MTAKRDILVRARCGRIRNITWIGALLAMAVIGSIASCGGEVTQPVVIGSVTVSPATTTLTALGDTVTLSAVGKDLNGNVVSDASVSWTSSATAVATVSDAGVVTAVSNGTSTLTATIGGVSGTATVMVAQAVDHIAVTPNTPTLAALGATQQFTAQAMDSKDQPLATQPPFSWASSEAGVATIDASTGVATAIGNGTTTITASADGVGGTTTLTVAQTVASIEVSPANPTLTSVNATQTFTAEAFDANAVSLTTQPTFAWSSSQVGVATIDAGTGVATAKGDGTTTITASASGVNGTTTLTVSQELASIVVSPAAPTLTALNATQQFSAEARDAGGQPLAVQPTFTWSSSQTGVATIDAGTGLATAKGNGTTTITASASGVDGTATLTVSQDLASIVVSPANPTLTAINATQAFTAEAFDANAVSLSTQPTFTWGSSQTGVATINSSTGVATAKGEGNTTITASAGGVDGTTTLTVSQALASIVVSPADPTLTAVNATQQFTAEARDAADQPLAAQPTFTWSSLQTGVATIDGTGLATAKGDGTTTITASAGGVDGTTTLTVAQALVSIVVSPTDPTLTAIGATQQFTAEAFDANSVSLGTQPTFTWGSSQTGVATIDAAGLAEAKDNGTTTITASASGMDGTTTLTVAQAVASIVVSPADPTLTAVNATQQFTAEAFDAQNQSLAVQPTFAWGSSLTGVATIDGTGLATAKGDGTTTITASAGGVDGTTTLTIAQAVASVVVSPADPTLNALTTQQFTAEAFDANSVSLGTQPTFTWGSSQTSVATIDGTGLATAKGDGTTTITASAGGVDGTTTLTVAQTLASIVVTPADPTLTAVNATQQFAAEARDAADQPLIVQPTFTWNSSLTGVATIDGAGLATAKGDGTTTIKASADGVDGTTTLTVAQAVASIVVSPTDPTLDAIGATQQFTAEAFDANSVSLGTQPTFTWGSSETGVATIDGTGLAEAKGNGTTTITASADAVDGTTTLTVTQVVASIAFATQPGDAYAGATFPTSVTVELRDANGNVVTNATDDVTADIGTDPSGSATLTGTTTQAAVAGIATFDDLEIDKYGTGYTLTATLSALNDTSDPFTVTLIAAYVTNRGSASVSVVNRATNAVMTTIPGAGTGPFGIAITPDQASAYVADNGADSVTVLDVATNTVVAQIAVGASPRDAAVAPDGGTVFVSNGDGASMSAISTATNTVSATPTVGGNPLGLLVSAEYVWVTDITNSRVRRYDRVGDAIDSTVTVGGTPWYIAPRSNGRYLYVTNETTDNVSIIDTTDFSVTSVTVGDGPKGIAMTPDEAYAYIANWNDGTVSVLRTSDNTVVTTVTVGTQPVGVAVSDDGKFVYVANSGDGTISVIQTVDNTVTMTVTVGTTPWDIALVTLQ